MVIPNNTVFLRYTAIKTTISELLSGDYVQENEQNPNYLLTPDNKKIFRLNLMASIVSKEQQGNINNLLIDDGTEKIILRLFEENSIVKLLKIGDIILIIGRIRVYNRERYISPEIIIKINPLWLKVRALELKQLADKMDVKEVLEESVDEEIIPNIFITERIDKINNQIGIQKSGTDTLEHDSSLPTQKLSKLIAELDEGNGVLIEEIIEKSPLEKTDELIEKMLKRGDIFQNIPGKVKVL